MTDQLQMSLNEGETSSRLVAIILEGAQSRLQAVTATVFGGVCEVAMMVSLDLIGAEKVLGLPGPLAVAIAAIAGVYAGAGAGVTVAVIGALAFFAVLADFGRQVHPLVVIPSAILWISMAYFISRGGGAIRRQVVARLRAQDHTETLYRRLEQSLLPKTPVTHPYLNVSSLYLPGERGLRLGGDFFDLAVLDDDRLALVIGDVSGHGPRAAALGAMLRGAWRGLVGEAPPEATAQALHRIALTDGAADDAYATALFAWIDADGTTLSLMSAGHPAPLLITEQVTEVKLEPLPPLGFMNGTPPWRLTTVALPPDWTLLFYTDGLTEMRAGPDASERTGLRTVCEKLTAMDYPLTHEALARLVAGLVAESGGELADDVAAVAIYGKSPDRQQSRRRTGEALQV